MDYKSKAETDDDSYGVILWQTFVCHDREIHNVDIKFSTKPISGC